MASKPYDVIVVGARCAGSPTAMLLARSGHLNGSDQTSTGNIQALTVLDRSGQPQRLGRQRDDGRPD